MSELIFGFNRNCHKIIVIIMPINSIAPPLGVLASSCRNFCSASPFRISGYKDFFLVTSDDIESLDLYRKMMADRWFKP